MLTPNQNESSLQQESFNEDENFFTASQEEKITESEQTVAVLQRCHDANETTSVVHHDDHTFSPPVDKGDHNNHEEEEKKPQLQSVHSTPIKSNSAPMINVLLDDFPKQDSIVPKEDSKNKTTTTHKHITESSQHIKTPMVIPSTTQLSQPPTPFPCYFHLEPASLKSLRMCNRHNLLPNTNINNTPPPCDTMTHAFYGNAEYATCEGYILPRSYEYLYGVALGIEMLHSSLLTKMATLKYVPDDVKNELGESVLKMFQKNKQEVRSGSRSRRGSSKKKEEEEKEGGCKSFQIIGCTEASEWFAPQRARAARRKRNGGLLLLSGYTCFLYGEFDSSPSSVVVKEENEEEGKKKTRKKRASARANATNHHNPSECIDYYSKERIVALLELCKANVIDMHSCAPNEKLPVSFKQQQHDEKVIILIRKDATSVKEYKAAQTAFRRVVHGGVKRGKPKDVPVVRCNWLLDSIGDYAIKDVCGYTEL